MPRSQKLVHYPKRPPMIAQATADFVAMVSHQLKGPLGGIRAATTMLADGDYGRLPKQAKETTVLVAHTTARLIALIDTYLNSTRLDLGSFELNPKLTDLRKEVEELVAVMTPLAALKHLTVKLDMAERFPQVIVDGNIVSNIIFNLLDNGIAYTDRGSINVHITLDDHTLRIEVRDTGVGMRPEEAGKLFQKFQRGVMGEERRHKGTGLGLFLVKRLVETAGGTVAAESAGPGKGSTFTARVPVSFKAAR